MKITYIQLSNAEGLINAAKVRYMKQNPNVTKVSNERVTLEALREYSKNGK